ncbi:MAG: dephospho-CoA kinase [Desulfofustis sp.]|nr:dephospho-CoA kinase [Desulfofustis sp.]NNF46907.1 dephospho-CoA kinase [Desulfofustis sp.]NNK55901.1 dephospho-CoA kinase [Desulfofustis sp.]
MLVGITGTIGSGKSVVARMLGELLSATVFSSDEICRRLLEKGEAGYKKMLENWGDLYLNDSREVDRPLLRKAVFADQKVRTALEDILHPLVRLELLEAKDAGGSTTIQLAEVPLLFECGWQADFDYIVCVITDPDIALQRAVERDSVRPAEVEKIARIQLDGAFKAERSDWVIDNSGSLNETWGQVQQLAAELRELLTLN